MTEQSLAILTAAFHFYRLIGIYLEGQNLCCPDVLQKEIKWSQLKDLDVSKLKGLGYKMAFERTVDFFLNYFICTVYIDYCKDMGTKNKVCSRFNFGRIQKC